MIHIGCQILVFRFTAQVIVGSPPNQSKKMTEVLKQKYELTEGIVCSALDIGASSWRSQLHPFQLVYSFFLLLSLLSFPLKLSAASLLLLLFFPLSPFTTHLTSFIRSILAVASSTSSCQGTKSHRGDHLSAWALLSRAAPTQHVLQQQFPQKRFRCGSPLCHSSCWNGTTEGTLQDERSGSRGGDLRQHRGVQSLWKAQLQPYHVPLKSGGEVCSEQVQFSENCAGQQARLAI